MKKGKKGRICAIYIRCSTKDQEEHGQSLEYQENECKEYIKNNKLAYFQTYKDVISGSTRHSKRPGMTEMFNDIKDGLFDAIVIQAIDRLCRDLDASGEINLFLQDNNVTVYQTRCEYDDTTLGGKSRKNIDRMLGQLELDRLKERTKLGRLSKMRTDGWVGGRIPFGYKKPETSPEMDTDTGKTVIPVINEDQAETVRLIYKLYWEQNKELKSLVKYLNENKIKAGQYNKSGKWTNPAVTRILKDHKNKYEGEIINKNIAGNRWGKILDKEYPIYPREKE